MSPLPSTYGETHGLALMEGLEDAGKLVFSTADAKAIGKRRGMTPAQVLLLTSRLARAGWIRRIKRGLYATTGKLPGSMAPHDFTVALALASPSALGHRTTSWALQPFRGRSPAPRHWWSPVDAWEQSREQRLGD
jgi:predicted transcriptional regulator of viral defense system